MVWSNKQDSKFEAELSFPLPEGGSVCGYAVDVDNKLVPGVIVGKEKARATFEAEVRKDRGGPALIEQSSGNVFTTRINPFLPFGHRTIQVTFMQDLTSHINTNGQTVNTYILPFLPPLNSSCISTLSIDVSGQLTPQLAPSHGFIDEETLKEAFWTSSSNGQVGTRTKTLKGSTTAWKATQPLTLELTGSQTDASVVCEHCGQDTISIAASIKNIPTGSSAASVSSSWSTSKIGLLWDTSKSRVESEADIMMELGAVQAVLNHLQYQSSGEKFELDLFPFNATVSNSPIAFNSDNLIRVTEKLKDSSSITYHGGTNYSALAKLVRSGHTLLGSMLSTYKFWILVTDGISTFGEQTVPDLQAPVYIISAATSGDPTFLRRWARQSNGKYFNLRAGASHADIIQGLTDTSTNFLYATLGDIVLTTEATPIDDFLEVQPLESKTCIVPSTPKILDTGSLRFYARVNLSAPKYAALLASESSAILTVHFGAKSTATVTHRHSFEVDLHELLMLGVPTPVAISERAWAQARLAEVHEMIEALGKNTESDEKTRLEKEQLSLSRHFTVVTPNTSLIVLDTLQQFLDHMICPPMALTDIYKQYQKRIAARVAEEESKRFEKTSRVHSWWQRRRKWADENEYVHQRASSAVHDQDGFEIDEREIAFRTFGTSELDFKANRHVFHEYAFDGEELNGAPITSRDAFNQQWHMASPGEKKWPGLPIRSNAPPTTKSGHKGRFTRSSYEDSKELAQLDDLVGSLSLDVEFIDLLRNRPNTSESESWDYEEDEDGEAGDLLDDLLQPLSDEGYAMEEKPVRTLWSLQRSDGDTEREQERAAAEYESFLAELEMSMPATAERDDPCPITFSDEPCPPPPPTTESPLSEMKMKKKHKKEKEKQVYDEIPAPAKLQLSEAPTKNASKAMKSKPALSSLKDKKPASPRGSSISSISKKSEEMDDDNDEAKQQAEEPRELSRRRMKFSAVGASSSAFDSQKFSRSGKVDKKKDAKERPVGGEGQSSGEKFHALAAPPRDVDVLFPGDLFGISTPEAPEPMPAAPAEKRSSRRRTASPPPPAPTTIAPPTSTPMPAAQPMPPMSAPIQAQQQSWNAPAQAPLPSRPMAPKGPRAPPKPAPISRNRSQAAEEEEDDSVSGIVSDKADLADLDFDVRRLKDMSRDISSLVQEQYSMLDSIEKNVECSSREVMSGQNELLQAAPNSSSTGKAFKKLGGFVSGLLSRAEPSMNYDNPLYAGDHGGANPLFSDGTPTIGFNSYPSSSSSSTTETNERSSGGGGGFGFLGGKKSKRGAAPSAAPGGYAAAAPMAASSSSRMEEVNMKIDDVKSVMLENIDRVLERGERLETLMDTSEELSTQSMSFYKNSSQLKSRMWYRSAVKIFGFLAVLLGILVLSYMFFDYVLVLLKGLAFIVPSIVCTIAFWIFAKETRSGRTNIWLLPFIMVWLLPLLVTRALYFALTLSNGWALYIAINIYVTSLAMIVGAICQPMSPRKRLPAILICTGLYLAFAGIFYACLYFFGDTVLSVCLYLVPLIFTATIAYMVQDVPSTIAGTISYVFLCAIWSTWISSFTSTSVAVTNWLLLYTIVGSLVTRPFDSSLPAIRTMTPRDVHKLATIILGTPLAASVSYLFYNSPAGVWIGDYLLRIAPSVSIMFVVLGAVAFYLEEDRFQRRKVVEGFAIFTVSLGAMLVALKVAIVLLFYSIVFGNSIYLSISPTILTHPYITLSVIGLCFIVPFVIAIAMNHHKRPVRKFTPSIPTKPRKAEKKPKQPKAPTEPKVTVETVQLRQSRRGKKAPVEVEQNSNYDSAFISFGDNLPPIPASEVHTIDLYDPYDVSAVPAPNTPMMNQYDLVQFDRPRFSFISATPDGSDRRTMKFNLSWQLPSEVTDGAPDAPVYESAVLLYNSFVRSQWSANDASHISRVFQLAVAALKWKNQRPQEQVVDFALNVMSNLAEGHLGKVQLLRAIAYKLEECELFEDAEHIYRRVLELRGEEPQSYRDLALVLAKQSKYAECISLYDKILTRCKPDWDARFSQVEVVALMDLCGILPLMDRMETTISGFKIPYSIVPALSSPVEADLRSVLTWDVDGLDIELQVEEPDGTILNSFANQSSTGGLLSRDFSGGYGPVEYIARRAFPGTYTFYAKVKSPCAKPILGGEVTIRHTIHTDFGTAGLQKSSTRVLRFQPRHGQRLELATVKVDALHK